MRVHSFAVLCSFAHYSSVSLLPLTTSLPSSFKSLRVNTLSPRTTTISASLKLLATPCSSWCSPNRGRHQWYHEGLSLQLGNVSVIFASDAYYMTISDMYLSSKSQSITLKNKMGHFSQEKIGSMLKEAKDFPTNDRAQFPLVNTNSMVGDVFYPLYCRTVSTCEMALKS